MDDLVERARRGDADAFVRLFEREKIALWRSIRAIVGNDHDAADVLQETALRAWKALPQFNGKSAFGTWVMRIALNAGYDAVRRNNREQACNFGALAAESAGTRAVLPSAVEDLASQWEPSSNASLDVQRTLGRLSPTDRLVLTLFYVNDLPCAQVSEVLGISEGAVRTRLTRARARFREAYEDGSFDARQKPDGDDAALRAGAKTLSPRVVKAASNERAQKALSAKPMQASEGKKRESGSGTTGIEARGLV